MKHLQVMVAAVMLVVLVAGCVAPGAPVPQAPAAVTQVVTQVVEKVVTPTPVPSATPITSPKAGGTLTVGMLNDFDTFDPYLILWVNFPMRANLYDSLLRYRHNLDPLPGLAESWEISPDGLQVTLHLRQGVKFHNGRELVADDIAQNIKRAQNPDTCGHLCGAAQKISAVETPDKYTVVLHYPKINTAWADFLEDFYVVAPESFDHLKDAPIGTGPYMFKEYIPNDHATFVKNPNYWGKEGPYLDQVVYKPFGGDEKAESSALLTGGVDILHDTPFSEREQLKDKGFQIFTGDPGALVECLYINPTKITDKRVRQALTYALDRQAAIDAMFFGDGEPYWSPYPKESWAWDAKVDNAVPYDLDKAKALLKEAGAENLKLTFLAYSLDQVQMASVMQAALKSIGVDMAIQMGDFNAWWDAFSNLKYDIVTSYISGSNKDPAQFYGDNRMFKVYPDSQMIKEDVFWPRHPVTNEAYGDLVAQGGSTLDKDKRKEIYTKIQEIFLDESWANCYTRRDALFAAAPYVRGFDWRLDDGILLEKVWLAK